MVATDPTPVPPTFGLPKVGALRDDALRASATTATPPRDAEASPDSSLPDSERSLLSAVLNPQIPADSIDPVSLSEALKTPAFTDALDARRFLDSLRLDQEISA